MQLDIVDSENKKVGAFEVRPPIVELPIGEFVLLCYPAVVAYRASLLEDLPLRLGVTGICAALPIGVLAANTIYGAVFEGFRYSLDSILGLEAMWSWWWGTFFAAALAGSWVMRRGGRTAKIAGSVVALAVFVVCYVAGAFLSHLWWRGSLASRLGPRAQARASTYNIFGSILPTLLGAPAVGG